MIQCIIDQLGMPPSQSISLLILLLTASDMTSINIKLSYSKNRKSSIENLHVVLSTYVVHKITAIMDNVLSILMQNLPKIMYI